MSHRPGLLALEDGTVLKGRGFGAARTVVGEAVFNTSLTGYQEVLTDPSYFGQIVAMTAVQIGNTGVNPEDDESSGPKVRGFVVRDLSPVSSNWRSRESLPDYLERHGIPGVTGIDTRALTKRLRTAGALRACLTTEDMPAEEAVARARAWEGLVGFDYVREVTCPAAYAWTEDPDTARFRIPGTNLPPLRRGPRLKVAAFDFGAKRNIFRKLAEHGFDVTVLPAHATAAEVRALAPDGIFLSNGPGDPAAVTYAHATVADLIGYRPIFGICLGHQIITHALGARTIKLKFGHRGGNQPVKNLITGQVAITSQNHGFAATPEELARCGAEVTEINLNDGTVEGLRLHDHPVFSVQYHPEAAPGPHDQDPHFATFYEMVAAHRGVDPGARPARLADPSTLAVHA